MSFELPGVEQGSDIETLFKVVGFVVVQWGAAEQTLDLSVAAIFRFVKGHPLLKRRPTTLNQKVDLLRKCFSEIPKLQQFNPAAGALLDRFANAAQTRNDLVHGGIMSLSPDRDGFPFAKIDVLPKSHHGIRSASLDPSTFPAFRRELIRRWTILLLGMKVQK